MRRLKPLSHLDCKYEKLKTTLVNWELAYGRVSDKNLTRDSIIFIFSLFHPRLRLQGSGTPETSWTRYLCSIFQLLLGLKIHPQKKVSTPHSGFLREAEAYTQLTHLWWSRNELLHTDRGWGCLYRNAEASSVGPGVFLLPLLVLWSGVHAEFSDSPALPVYKVQTQRQNCALYQW